MTAWGVASVPDRNISALIANGLRAVFLDGRSRIVHVLIYHLLGIASRHLTQLV